ncbi:MAG: hypothetical protein ACJ79S_05595 [Gemmatimonadaceae bacterium]
MTTPNAENEPAGQRPADVPRKADVWIDVPRTPDDRPTDGELRVEQPLAGKPRPGEPTYPDVRVGDLSPDPSRERRDTPDTVDPDVFEYAESALGGADTVQKTSYVTGEGTEPSGAPRASVVARTPAGGGVNVTALVIGLLALAIALVYALGIFR